MARSPRRDFECRRGRPRGQRVRSSTLSHARPPPRGELPSRRRATGRRALHRFGEGGAPMTIPIKNKDGIARMREACAIAATVLEQLKPLVRPGITTQDLEEAGRDLIARLGARSACYGYQHGSRRYPA